MKGPVEQFKTPEEAMNLLKTLMFKGDPADRKSIQTAQKYLVDYHKKQMALIKSDRKILSDVRKGIINTEEARELLNQLLGEIK